MNEFRELRHQTELTQEEFAQRLGVPVNTLRMWDSGLRATPTRFLTIARQLGAEERHQAELLPICQLAAELRIHKSTLESAIRTGRLPASFSVRSAFGRPIRRVMRSDGYTFLRQDYGRRAMRMCAPPLPSVPTDFDERIRHLRGRMRLTQAEFAQQIGAAGKAVVYQWETRKRIPSRVFWQRIQAIEAGAENTTSAATSRS